MSDRLTILTGDCRELLKTLPDESVHCCVTSPPYWALRDYGVAGQVGLESTIEEYVAGMVEVFREVRRVLRGDGSLWLKSDHAKALNALGRVYMKSGRIKEAKEALESAKTADPGLEETTVLLSNIRDEFSPEGKKHYSKKKGHKGKKGKSGASAKKGKKGKSGASAKKGKAKAKAKKKEQ